MTHPRHDLEVKTAVLVAREGVTPEVARERLADAGGILRRALGRGPASGSSPSTPGGEDDENG